MPGIYLIVGKPNDHYPLKEINRTRPDWVKIKCLEKDNTVHWANAHCGITKYNQRDTNTCNANAGKANSYALALSSQPGFCHTYSFDVVLSNFSKESWL